MFSCFVMDRTTIWKSELSYTTRAHVYTLMEGKHMVLDDVMDVFVLIIIDSFKKDPYLYKRRAAISLPLALLMSQAEQIAKDALTLAQHVVCNFIEAELILLPIILNGHFHLIVLDKRKEYIHYSSSVSLTYDKDAVGMVNNVFVYDYTIIFISTWPNQYMFYWQRELFDGCLVIELWEIATEKYPLIHECNCRRQKKGSIDCPIYVMPFIELILNGKKLCLPQNDVLHMRLHFTACILMAGIARGGQSFTNPKKT